VNRAPSRDLTIVALVVFVVSVGALVTLELANRPTTTVMALVGPVVAALFIAGHVNRVTDEQNHTLTKIEKQTNGVLDDRIKTQTKAALVEAGVVTPDLPEPAPRHELIE
jgi:hypothetical protein